uniref:Uncharacterized protein n=1 Tax=Setaria viridis TaxID=4556 RepID=A0A4V6D3Y9_SETVI|nr:hypothetical protein SEVIR_9G138000v2 [Setaria viridis]
MPLRSHRSQELDQGGMELEPRRSPPRHLRIRWRPGRTRATGRPGIRQEGDQEGGEPATRRERISGTACASPPRLVVRRFGTGCVRPGDTAMLRMEEMTGLA